MIDTPLNAYQLIQTGGVIAVLLICVFGIVIASKRAWIEWGPSLTRERTARDAELHRERERAEKAEGDRDRLHKQIEETVIPALIASTNNGLSLTQKFERQHETITSLTHQVEELRREK